MSSTAQQNSSSQASKEHSSNSSDPNDAQEEALKKNKQETAGSEAANHTLMSSDGTKSTEKGQQIDNLEHAFGQLEISEPFNIKRLKPLVQKRYGGDDVFNRFYIHEKRSNRESLPVGGLISHWAHGQALEYMGLLAYIDDLEMKVKHLQNHLAFLQKGGVHQNDKPLPDCDCLVCTAKRKSSEDRSTSLQAENSLAPSEQPKPSDAPQVTQAKVVKDLPKWETRVPRKKELMPSARDGGIKKYIDDEEPLPRSVQNIGGPIMELYRSFSSDGEYKGSWLALRSPRLVSALLELLTDSPGDDYNGLLAPEPRLSEPYMILFQNRKLLQDRAQMLDEEPREHLNHLLGFIQGELPHVSRKLDDLENKRTSTTSFDTVWLLYRPGTTVYQRVEQEWVAFKVLRQHALERRAGTSQYDQYVIKAGTFWLKLSKSSGMLKPETATLTVMEFAGEKKITDLNFIPEEYLHGREAIREQLIERGRHYSQLGRKPCLKDYTGDAWQSKTLETDRMRVMVDIGVENSDSNAPTLYSLADFVKSKRGMRDADDNSHYTPLEWNIDPEQDPEEVFLICDDRVKAFSLRRKTWEEEVEVSKLFPPEFERGAFERLVASSKTKKLVEAMVKSHIDKASNLGDLVKDKGRGLILLLHGSPGTGKTLTAECVAESQERPLYMMTCGELGVDPDELENKIRAAFDQAVRWNAVLLLDEADVFLQERDIRDLYRNALVSVFLRELEYFDGILLLTTNRPGIIDEAFQSRIHLMINMPDLDEERQMKVWKLFLKGQGLNDNETITILAWLLEDAAKDRFNGRQIRNIVHTAAAKAAQSRSPKITKEHISDVIDVSREYTEYMKKLDGMNTGQRAAAQGIRANVWIP